MADTTTIITGNLTDNPELKFTPNGAAVANFRVAVTPRVRDGNDWKDGETSFFRINAWRQLAENATESLSSDDRVIVVGRLKARTMERSQFSSRRPTGGDPITTMPRSSTTERHRQLRMDRHPPLEHHH
jgi:single-strand DNA-binding protein